MSAWNHNEVVASDVCTPSHRQIDARRYVSPDKDSTISDYWYSIDACNLFHPDKDVHPSVYHCLIDRIEVFEKALSITYGWHICIEGGNTKDDMTEYKIKRVE